MFNDSIAGGCNGWLDLAFVDFKEEVSDVWIDVHGASDASLPNLRPTLFYGTIPAFCDRNPSTGDAKRKRLQST